MTGQRIPRDIEIFILKNIHSIEQLEVLLFLRKESKREWSAIEVSAALRSSSTSVEARLTDLLSRKFVAARPNLDHMAYIYLSTTDNNLLVDKVAQYYGTHRHAIIELIYSRPAENIRVLADAFRIWKDKM